MLETLTPKADGAFDLDFTGADEQRLVSEGIYPARVDEADIHDSASSGKPALYLTLKMLGPEQYYDWTMWYVVSLQPQSRGILKGALIGLGYPKEDVSGPVSLNPANLLDKTCGIRVVHQTYNDELRNRVARLIPIDSIPEDAGQVAAAPFDASDVAGETPVGENGVF